MNKKNYNLKQKQKNWNISLLKLDEEQLTQITGGDLPRFKSYSNVTLKRGVL
ncbi:hypothetical protein [Anabaena sp. CCY 0017]|uniref:hypothetical protein n=1 Tax=Anabaena sp. CCY 0017 TaxID=3103866 RepID=UPI0039C681CF